MPLGDRRHVERRAASRRVSDRRRPRLAVHGLPVRLLRGADGGTTVVTGRLLDISSTGIRLAVDAEVTPREMLLIEARLPDGGCLNLAARVAWVRPAEAAFAVGCKLSAPPAAEKLADLRRLARAAS